MPTISGVTRDGGGQLLGGVTVNVFDATNDALVATGTSDASTGAYSLTVAGAGPFFVVAHKAGTSFLAGTTRRDLAAVADVPAGDGTTVRTLWTGVPTTDGIMVSARMNSDKTANASRLVISRSADLSSPVKTSVVAPDVTYRIAKHTATGLLPDTEYFYGVEIDGVLDTATKGRFKTAPVGAANFKVALACCHNNSAGDAAKRQKVFERLNAMGDKPYALVFLGDFHYFNDGTTLESNKIQNIDDTLGTPERGLVHRMIPTAYMWDDHDFGPDNSTGRDGSNVEHTYRQPVIDMFRRRMPFALASNVQTDTVDYSFVAGRVRFIVSDLRGDKTAEGTADTTSKTMMGAAQKARWKAEIAAAKAAGEYVCWVSSVPWTGPANSASNTWAGYNTERVELANYIAEQGMGNRVCVIAGDAHSLGITTGTKALTNYATVDSANLPTFQIGAANSNYSVKMEVEQGPFPIEGDNTVVVNHFGMMEVVDNGTDLTIRWNGIEANTNDRVMSHTFAAIGAPIAIAAEPPTRVIKVTAVSGIKSAEITITPPYSDGGAAIARYSVVSEPPGGVDSGEGTTSLTRTVTGLTPGVAYKFKGTAINNAGTSPASPLSASTVPQADPNDPVAPSTFEATGGTITEPGDGYKYWTFTNTGATTLNVTAAGDVEYLVVGGGGSGAGSGSNACGGGGAGGLLKGVLAMAVSSTTITVGAGGGSVTSGSISGANSSIGALVVANGGGGGAGSAVAKTGASGGGGAGATGSAGLGAAGIDGQGFAGGLGFGGGSVGALRAGAGGGGSTAAGYPGASGYGGDGGEGTLVWGTEYAGGGGGSVFGEAAGTTPVVVGNGKAGGGNAGNINVVATSAAPNSGSGGGGAYTGSSGAGGSGIVIIRKKL